MVKSNSSESNDDFGPSSDELKDLGIYYIQGEIDSGNLVDIHQDILLKYIKGFDRDIQLFINSPGGDAIEGWALIDLLRFIEPRIETKTFGMGQCSSLGAILLAAGTKGKRIISPRCSVMTHQARLTGFESSQKDDLLSIAEDMKQEYNRHLSFWTEATGLTSTEVKKRILAKTDKFFTAEKAVELGIADIIME